jgi:DNA-binding LacI/PurR family transcriptional regulator
MRFEATNIKDIAKALGISTSTVSRALRDSYEVSETTKQLVTDYAKKINYKPNPIALSLRLKKSKSIGVIVAEVSNNFFSQVITGIESVANENGYTVIITQSLENLNNEINNVSFLASRAIDGCLVSVSSETNDFAHFTDMQEKGFPIVFFDRIVEKLNGHAVAIDNVQAAYDATLHLLKNGYCKIAFIANAPTLYITTKRLEGYKKALHEYNISIDESLIKYCLHGGMYVEEAMEALDELFQNANKPNAILASTDQLTIACMRYCKKSNLEVPGDIALCGFSNSDTCDLLNPALTVVRQPAIQMGKIAAQLLIKTIESRRQNAEYEKKFLPAELLIGKSSKSNEL